MKDWFNNLLSKKPTFWVLAVLTGILSIATIYAISNPGYSWAKVYDDDYNDGSVMLVDRNSIEQVGEAGVRALFVKARDLDLPYGGQVALAEFSCARGESQFDRIPSISLGRTGTLSATGVDWWPNSDQGEVRYATEWHVKPETRDNLRGFVCRQGLPQN